MRLAGTRAVAASVVVDTGPIVAFLDADDQFHAWAKEQFARLRPPLLTCEAVLTEACFLIDRAGGDESAVVQLVERGVLKIVQVFDAEAASIARLMRRYKNLPCLWPMPVSSVSSNLRRKQRFSRSIRI